MLEGTLVLYKCFGLFFVAMRMFLTLFAEKSKSTRTVAISKNLNVVTVVNLPKWV